MDKLSYPWLVNVPRINRPYGLADLDAARGPVELEAIVFAEVWVGAGLHLDEAAWVQPLADGDPRLQGIIATPVLGRECTACLRAGQPR